MEDATSLMQAALPKAKDPSQCTTHTSCGNFVWPHQSQDKQILAQGSILKKCPRTLRDGIKDQASRPGYRKVHDLLELDSTSQNLTLTQEDSSLQRTNIHIPTPIFTGHQGVANPQSMAVMEQQ